MPIPGSSIDVPCSLFSGLNTELSPSDLPEGVSPSNQDVCFLPGSVATRPAAKRLFSTLSPSGGPSGAVYFKTFSPDGGAVVSDNGIGGLPVGAAIGPQIMLFDSLGYWWQERVASSPGTLTRQFNLIPPGARLKSVSAFNREFVAISDGSKGLARPIALDQAGNWRRVSMDGPGKAPTVADSATAGSISAGTHQCVQMFLTDTGYITRPSPPASWSAAGSKKVTVSNLAVGPSNVIARVLAFTGAGGDNFFTILQNVTFPTAVSALVVFDNTSTSVTVDFSDNALFAATAIDIPGNNLFAQVPVAPCIGFTSYASRLFVWGEINRVENLYNMSFESNPSAWNPGTGFAGGGLVGGGTGILSGINGILLGSLDQFWAMTGDGTNNPKGQIQQACYRDAFGIEILSPKTAYEFFGYLVKTSADTTGNFIADIYSATGGGQLAQATIPLSRIQQNTPTLLSQPFNNALPASIPSDTVLRIYTTGTASGQNVAVTEMSVAYAAQPYKLTARASYVNNPEAIDAETGEIGPASDPTPIQDIFVLRDYAYMLTQRGLHESANDPSFEPSGWTIHQVADDCGSFGPLASTGGEDWRAWAGPTGYRIFEGQFPWKISQEIQTKWDAINLSAQQTVWTVNDPVNRRAYVGVPTGTATSPNQIYVLDYRQLDTAYEIGKGDTIHISFTGKMIASDLARKWTVWNLASNHGAILQRSGNQSKFCIGGPYGNIHYFDPAFYTDDDYGQVASEYYSYFFINHEAEQMLGVGSHRKLYTYLSLFVSGVGQLTVTPYAASLTNPCASLPPITLSLTPGHDLEWPINVLSERASFKFKVTPLTGQTDAYFNLQKMVVRLREDPFMPVRGAI